MLAQGQELWPGPALGDTLVVEADGCLEHVDGAWHEVKVGWVAPLSSQLAMDERAGRVRRKTLGAHYVAGMREHPDAFFQRLYAKATELGAAGGGRGRRRAVDLAGCGGVFRTAGSGARMHRAGRMQSPGTR